MEVSVGEVWIPGGVIQSAPKLSTSFSPRPVPPVPSTKVTPPPIPSPLDDTFADTFFDLLPSIRSRLRPSIDDSPSSILDMLSIANSMLGVPESRGAPSIQQARGPHPCFLPVLPGPAEGRGGGGRMEGEDSLCPGEHEAK